MKNDKQGFITPFLIVVITILAIGAGIYIFKNNERKPQVSISNSWKIYTNTQYGFEFQYPADFKLQDYNDTASVFGKTLVQPTPSLTGIYITAYKDYNAIKDIIDKNSICGLKNSDVAFGVGNMRAREYSCGDAGTDEDIFLISISGGLGLDVSVTTDSGDAGPETSNEAKKLAPEIVSKILSSFTSVK